MALAAPYPDLKTVLRRALRRRSGSSAERGGAGAGGTRGEVVGTVGGGTEGDDGGAGMAAYEL